MSIIDSFLNYFGYVKAKPPKPVYPEWALARADVEQWDITDPSVYGEQARLYQLSVWLQIAITITSAVAAETPLNVLRVDGEEREDAPNHPFEMRLINPNPNQSRFEFLNSTFVWRLLTANAYWHVNASAPGVPPAELWVVPPSQIKPVPDGKSFIKGYDYDPGDGQIIRLEPWQIVHYHGFSPFSMFDGMSQLAAVATDIKADYEVAKWNRTLYEKNNGRLPGILSFANQIPDPDWKQIIDQVNKASQSRNIMMLRGTGMDVAWTSVAQNMRDMETYQGREFTFREVMNLFAPGAVSFLSENANEANARVGRQILTSYKVHPLQVEIAEKITQNIMPLYSDETNIYLAEFEDVRTIDQALKIQEIQTASSTHTVDEIRAKFYGEKPIGDERGNLLPSQVTPPQAAPAPEMTAQPAPVAETMPEPEQEESPADEAEDTAEQELPEVAAEKLRWMRKAINAVKANKPASVHFETIIIDHEQQVLIRKGLAMAETADDVRQVFSVNTGARKNIGATPEQVIEMLRLATEALKNV